MKPLETLAHYALRHIPEAETPAEKIAVLKAAAEVIENEALREQCAVTAATIQHAERCQLELSTLLKS